MSTALTPFLILAIPFGFYHLYVFLLRLLRPRLPYPPGPRGYPLIGNLFNEASKNVEQHEWARYLKMGKEYNSDVLHINVLGDHTLILNSAKTANELYWRKDRVSIPIDLSTSNFLRKLAPAEYSPLSIPDIEHAELESHVRNFAGSTILRVVYGMSTQEELNDYVQLAHLAAESLNATMNHGSASFKRKANTWAPMVSNLINAPWKRVKSSMVNGTALPCFATNNLEKFNLVSSFDMKNNNLDQGMEEVIKNCSGAAYFGGTDTTLSLIMSSILVLSRHPEVLEKAHEELDRVIGTSRLPQLQDRDKLPYLQAFIKEVERMYPVTPLAVAHRVISDDICNGYFIPKGTTVVPNVGAILHSEELYQDPFKFNPDRFLQNDKTSKLLSPDPEIVAFGFGRRICSGRHFALDSAWSLIACLLATCDFTGPSEDAQKISRKPDPVLDYFDGLIVHPKPYKCRIVPRSIAALNLMKAGYENQMM
ncbi:cytochrome P450 [Dendrothele bispora CBS 962.96]|uniref:Cytochrome P450 n=1 Tax=Dendrothele bispora (strain CBS 962.96) TaxID=1314807 RepID=A0A4S8LRF3_DENBC|nr:cytochrome P450 [Dendrothele bispora CBS 962.96]